MRILRLVVTIKTPVFPAVFQTALSNFGVISAMGRAVTDQQSTLGRNDVQMIWHNLLACMRRHDAHLCVR